MLATPRKIIEHSPLIKDVGVSENIWTSITEEVQHILGNDESFPKKFRNENFFKRPSPKLHEFLKDIIEGYDFASSLTWHFEIFSSLAPTGLHNDRNLFEEQNELCELGLIIPLELRGGAHLTRFYDLYIPEKVNWDGEGNFRTLAKAPVPYDRSRLEAYEDAVWEHGKIIFFDSTQVHEAIFPATEQSFKLSINGLGYRPYKS